MPRTPATPATPSHTRTRTSPGTSPAAVRSLAPAWQAVVALPADAPAPVVLGAVYRAALHEVRFRRAPSPLASDALLDLAADIARRDAAKIAGARNPRAYFRKALRSRTTSLLRRHGAGAWGTVDDDGSLASGAPSEIALVAWIDLERDLDRLGDRDRTILRLVLVDGAAREELAIELGVTRAAVDKVVSRSRKLLRVA